MSSSLFWEAAIVGRLILLFIGQKINRLRLSFRNLPVIDFVSQLQLQHRNPINIDCLTHPPPTLCVSLYDIITLLSVGI